MRKGALSSWGVCCHWGVPWGHVLGLQWFLGWWCRSNGIHMNVRTKASSAKQCILTRWSMLFASLFIHLLMLWLIGVKKCDSGSISCCPEHGNVTCACILTCIVKCFHVQQSILFLKDMKVTHTCNIFFKKRDEFSESLRQNYLSKLRLILAL